MGSNNIYRILTSLLLLYKCQYIQSGPVVRPSRMVREIYPEVEQEIPDSSQTQVCIVGDVVYGAGETVPSEQPCLKCACAPPDVRCETEMCVPQPGCKAIHRPNKCCPDYQCGGNWSSSPAVTSRAWRECEHEGKMYGNGERLPMAPGGECWVCYCRGGEVQCAEVGCYTRSDCKPRYVTGQCCPIYDHCPPRDPLSDRIQYTTEPQLASMEPELITSSASNSSKIDTSSQHTTSDSLEEGSGEYPASSSPSSDESSSTQTTSSTFITDETKSRPATPITFSIKEIELKSNKKRTDDNVKIITKLDKSTQTDSEGRPQITIQEVIPPITEFKPPTVQKEAVSISPINPVTYRNDLSTTNSPYKVVTDTDNDLADVESYASEKTEVYDHPPPVLRIGDQLLFIKQGQLVPEKDASTPSPIITLIGAEGLQIGLDSGELIEQEILPINQEERSSEATLTSNAIPKKIEGSSTLQDLSTKLSSTDKSLSNDGTTPMPITNIKIISSEETETTLKSELSGNTNLPVTSEEFITVDSSKSSDMIPNKLSTKFEQILIDTSSTASNTNTPAPSTLQSNEKHQPEINSSEIDVAKSGVDQSEYMPEENPYYPSFPEDIMILGQNEETTEQGFSKINILLSTTDSNLINYTEISESSPSSEKSKINAEAVTVSNTFEKSSDEISVIPLQSTTPSELEMKTSSTSKQSDGKILPEVLDIISNSSFVSNQTSPSLEWLKNEPTKVSIPLINEEAALPDSLLSMTAASDLNSNVNDDSSEIESSIPTLVSSLEPKIKSTISNSKPITFSIPDKESTNSEIKSERIMTVDTPQSDESIEVNYKEITPLTSHEEKDNKEFTTNNSQHPSLMPKDDANVEVIINERIIIDASQSKETIEENEEADDSGEFTTSGSHHSSLMSNEDASVEAIMNDSKPEENSDLVEIMPGFEIPTPKVITTNNNQHEEKILEAGDNISPKDDVELINTDKVVNEDKSHTEMKTDFHDEIQKRDVVKKVLKDTFDNPKENIRTDIIPETTDYPFDFSIQTDEEQNVVKPIENHNFVPKNPIFNNTNITFQKSTSTEKINLDEKETTDDQEVVQKVNNDKNGADSQDSLSPTTLNVLRDFLKTQFRQYHNSKLTD